MSEELAVVEAVDTVPPPSARLLHEHRFSEALHLGDGDKLWVCFGCGERKVSQPWWRRVKRWFRLRLRKRKLFIDAEDTQ